MASSHAGWNNQYSSGQRYVHAASGVLSSKTKILGNNMGLILTYNLSVPFDAKSNTTGLLLQDTLTKARGGEGNSNEPDYYDGALLANDAQFFLYGGTILRNDAIYDAPDSDEVLSYQAYQYGANKPAWAKGFKNAKLGEDVTPYIAYGGAANAPSENKAWYFSGLTSSTHEVIYFNSNATTKAVNVSNSLIQVDMKEQLNEKWSNITLPDFIKGRAQAEVVWVPVGEQGILVVLGGVTYPEWAGRSHKSADEAASVSCFASCLREINANGRFRKKRAPSS